MNNASERTHAVVWAEIPVADMDRAMRFYAELLQAELSVNEQGPNPIADLPHAGGDGVAGHLYPGKPAPAGTGSTIHLAAPGTLESIMDRVRASGGEVVSDAITIPVGRFCYALDPDGNSIGLFEG